MARRADHTREELSDLALTAGHRRIQAHGYSQFSIRKVASDIGYTVGTLYNVFGDYDDFLLHINGRTLDLWYETLQGVMRQSGASEQPLSSLAAGYVAFSRAQPNLWSALFEHRGDATDTRPEWYQRKMERLFALAEEPLMRDMKLKPEEARRAAKVMWAGIHGICVLSSSGKLALVEADSAESLATHFVETYLAGLIHGK